MEGKSFLELRNLADAVMSSIVRSPASLVIYALLSIAVSSVIGALLILGSGADPLVAYRALIEGGIGTIPSASATLNLAAPLLLSGIGAAIAFRAGVFNIGQEGQIAVGGAAAAFIALRLPAFAELPPPVAVLLALSIGAIFGMLWASLTSVIHIYLGANEIIVSLLFALIGVLATNYLVSGPLFLESAGYPLSDTLPKNTWLPAAPPPSRLHIGPIIGVISAVAAWFIMAHTATGFELRTLGASTEAAIYAGVKTSRRIALAMALSGGLAGLGGAVEVLGSQHRLILGYSSGFGFTSLSVALLAGLNPLGCILSAFFFAFLDFGGLFMEQSVGVSSALTEIIEGLTILLLVSGLAIGEVRRRRAYLSQKTGVTT